MSSDRLEENFDEHMASYVVVMQLGNTAPHPLCISS